MCVSFLAKGLLFGYRQNNDMLLFTQAPQTGSKVHPACYFMCS